MSQPEPTLPKEERHDPEEVARDIARKLSSRARHVCLLIGAGASSSAGLPTLGALEQIVVEELDDEDSNLVASLLEDRNLEQVLSRLRRLGALLTDGEVLGGIDRERAVELDERMCQAIIGAIGIEGADITPFVRFASWAARMEGSSPLEVFTLNYDLLLEAGFEALGVPYFDGFVGGVSARFLPELIEPREAPESRRLPSGFVRLWKLHGSANWRAEGEGESWRMVRSWGGHPGTLAIYPSDEKYEESRRVPFVVLMDRFRRALLEQETITIVSGYSFSDEHVNEMLFDAAARHPRSEVLALCHGDIPQVAADRAMTTRNLVVLSPEAAIVGGQRAQWRDSQDVPGVYENDRFMLGDFSALTQFLARSVGPLDVD